MTKKDYKILAGVLEDCHEMIRYTGVDIDTLLTVQRTLMDALEMENPRFSRGKFQEACGFK